MTKIGLIGDTHGTPFAPRFGLWLFRKFGITKAIQVGDFGIYRHDNGFAKVVNLKAKEYGIELYVVPGNHENWDLVQERLDMGRNEDGWGWLRKDNLFLAPRVHSWEWDGVKFASLSGAPSVDRSWREQQDATHHNENVRKTRDKFWYAEEAITQENVDEFKKLGYVDVMIAHDAPDGVSAIASLVATNPHGFALRDTAYAARGRELLTEAFKSAAPKTFIHGHYHFVVNEHIPVGRDGELAYSHIVGLDRDTFPGNFGTFDTETGETLVLESNKWRQEFYDDRDK